MILNQFLIESTDNNADEAQNAENEAKNIKCCTDEAIVTSWCVECSAFYCDSCVQAHQKIKMTKDHTIKSKDEAMADIQLAAEDDERSLMCQQHPQVG